MPPLLSAGLRVLGVAGAACLVSAVSFYIVVMTGFSNRYILPNRLYEGLFLATVGLGGVALISATTPKHRLILILLGQDLACWFAQTRGDTGQH